MLGSIPRRDLRLLVPISSPETPASPHGKQVRLTVISLLNSFNREPSFEAAIIRLPSGSCTRLALRLSPPWRLSVRQAARPYTPRIACPVTRYKMWRHYMTDMGNCHGWSPTSWVAALSAAPFRIRFLGSQVRFKEIYECLIEGFNRGCHVSTRLENLSQHSLTFPPLRFNHLNNLRFTAS